MALVAFLTGSIVAVALLLERLLDVSTWRALSPSGRTILLSLGEAMLLVPVWVYALRGRGRWADLGLRAFVLARAIRASFFGFFLILAFNRLYAVLLSRWGLEVQPDVLPFFGLGLPGLILALLAAAVVAPLAEELFFRGFLYPAVLPALGRTASSLVSAAVFGLAHVLPTTLLPLFVIGLVLNWLYDETGSIWPGVFLHAALNGLALLIRYLVPSV